MSNENIAHLLSHGGGHINYCGVIESYNEKGELESSQGFGGGGYLTGVIPVQFDRDMQGTPIPVECAEESAATYAMKIHRLDEIDEVVPLFISHNGIERRIQYVQDVVQSSKTPIYVDPEFTEPIQ